jgi:hypothetical protein
LQGLVDLNLLDDIGGNAVELDLPDARLLRWEVYTVNRRVGQFRLRSANLYVFAFALVTLQGHAGQAAQRIRHVGVWQALNDPDGQHFDQILGTQTDIDRLDLGGGALGGHLDNVIFRGDLKLGV